MTGNYHLWKVSFRLRFDNPAVSDRYSYSDHTGFIFTEGDSLKDVQTEIQRTRSRQEEVSEITTAEYLGKTINKTPA